MEAVVSRSKAVSIAAASALAITLVFALGYYAVCALTPTLSSSLTGSFGLTIRFATMLKAFVVMTPFAAVGNAIGGMAFNVQSGDPLGVSMAFLHAAIGVAFWWVSRKIGRSVVKDVAVLSVYGVVNGSIAAMKLKGFAMLFQSEAWGRAADNLFEMKMLTSAATLVAGYLLVLAFGALVKGVRHERTSAE